MGMLLWLFIAIVLPVLVYLYVRRNDAALRRIPPQALALSPNRCSVKDVRVGENQLKRDPISVIGQLPPKTGRRYIVVGGAGFLGGWIVVHLLRRGEDPRRIRVIDIRPPTRRDLTTGPAKHIQFIQVDITDASLVEKSFKAPWPATDSYDPEPQITVFHTAANIRFYERHPSLLPYSTKVNVDGTNNVIKSSQSLGANILIFTSSGVVSACSTRFWLWPWETEPKFFVQLISDDDNLTPKNHHDFFSNYAVTKAQAERNVREADRSPSGKGVLRTGCIRPGCGVFGPGGDMTTSVYLRTKVTPTWMAPMLQSWIFVENCSVAHLLYEQRLIELSRGGSNPDIGGQAFCVADPGAPATYGDMYTTLSTLTDGELAFPSTSPTFMLFFSHIVEFYHLARQFLLGSWPSIGSWLPDGGLLMTFQPSTFTQTGVHLICDDSRARLAPQHGGLGYKGAWTTLQGMHKVVEEYRKSSTKPVQTGNVNAFFDVGLITTTKRGKLDIRNHSGVLGL